MIQGGAAVGKNSNLTPAELGKIGENSSIVKKNNETFYSEIFTTKSGGRIPDGITDTHLFEVKNVKYQSYTKQLREYLEFADKKNIDFILYLRPNTKVSKSLQSMFDSGRITRMNIPGL